MTRVSNKLKSQLVTKAERTVTDLAQMLDITRPALSNVLNGNADLSFELAVKIENTFGIDARKLLVEQLDESLAQIRAQMNGKSNG